VDRLREREGSAPLLSRDQAIARNAKIAKIAEKNLTADEL
jgi:hypothetical protein